MTNQFLNEFEKFKMNIFLSLLELHMHYFLERTIHFGLKLF